MNRRNLTLIAATALLTSVALASVQPSPAAKPTGELRRAAAATGVEPGACWLRYTLSLHKRDDDDSTRARGWVTRIGEGLLTSVEWALDAWSPSLSCDHVG